MSLLFDANLPPALVRRLGDVFPLCLHVQEMGLRTPDRQIWQIALERHLTIATKDTDFQTLAELLAPPGKVLLLTLGNCSTSRIEQLIRWEADRIKSFIVEPSQTLLVIPF